MKENIIKIAQSQIGLQEIPKGSNWGEHVKKYLNSVGITFPASWCMAFVYWCYRESARELGQINPLFKTGGVLAQWNKTSPLKKRTTPERGIFSSWILAGLRSYRNSNGS